MNIDIVPLHECKDAVEICAAWAFAEWGCYNSEMSLRSAVEYYQSTAVNDGLPFGWVAKIDGRVVGTITLKETEHPDRLDIGPWIGGVFVHPKYRGLGVAKKMCEFVEHAAHADFGFHECILQTHISEFYEAMEWKRIGEVRDIYNLTPDGHALMKKSL